MSADHSRPAPSVNLAFCRGPRGVRIEVVEDGAPVFAFDLTPGEADGIAAKLSHWADIAAAALAATHAGPGRWQ